MKSAHNLTGRRADCSIIGPRVLHEAPYRIVQTTVAGRYVGGPRRSSATYHDKWDLIVVLDLMQRMLARKYLLGL
jgi:hypothetical protein